MLSARIHLIWALRAGSRLGVGDDPRYNNSRCFEPFPFADASAAQQARIRDIAERLDLHRKRQLAAHPKLTITGMYNVLEKLRSGSELTDKDRVIHEQGLVSILRQLHDELDDAVFDAYGWPTSLTDEEILERLVALNAERAAEEARGLIRWLRPDFQAPKKPVATQVDMPGTRPSQPAPAIVAPAKAQKWPRTFPERTAQVRDIVLGAASDATFSVAEVAARFKGAKKAEVETILDTFAALGMLIAFDDEQSGTRRWARPARSVA